MKSLVAIGIWNVLVFIIYGVDKYKAKHHRRRISENFMMGIMLFFGGLGGGLGMIAFNHKTRKTKFKITAIISLLILALTLWLLHNKF